MLDDAFSALHAAMNGELVIELKRPSQEIVPASAPLDSAPAHESTKGSSLSSRDYQSSLRLLECAGQAMQILYDRRDALESSLRSLSSQAADNLARAEAKVLDWQRHAAAAKDEMHELERQLSAMRQRVEAGEAELEAQRRRADVAERQAGEAYAVLNAFHSKVLSIFGPEAKAHKALTAVADEDGNVFGPETVGQSRFGKVGL